MTDRPTSTAAGAGTLDFLRHVLAHHRRDTMTAAALILFANLLEGASAMALFPALALLFDSQGASGGAFARDWLARGLAAIGLRYTVESLLGLIAVAMLAKGVLHFLAMRRAGHLAVRLANGLRSRLIAALFEARWSFLHSRPLGDYATALTREADTTVNAFLQLAIFIATSGLAVVYLMVLLVVSWQGLLLSAAGVGASLLLFRPLFEYSRRVAGQTVALQKQLVRDLVDTVPAIKAIKAMNMERHFEPLLRRKTGQLEATERRGITASNLMPSMIEPLLTLVIVTGFILGSSVLNYGVPELTIVAFSLWRAGWQVNLAQQAYRHTVASEPFFWSITRLIESAEQARETATGTRALPEGPVQVALDSVSFAYGDQPVLGRLTMEIPAGRLTVITGASGTGKSTLVDVMLGLLKPDDGTVLANGEALDSIAVGDWRRSVGYVQQRTTLLRDSVRRNVAIGDPAIDRDAVERALRAAGAWDFVNALPQGMDTICGEAGGNLSGGQAQRIAIARALARAPRLLVLDEATASLDPETERRVIEDLAALRGQTTIVAVSHQPAITTVADRVYRIENGRAHLVGAQPGVMRAPVLT